MSLQEVQIHTVDRYQGDENDIIILSLVRCNPKRVIGFLKSESRFCVAMSRARLGFFIIGSFQHFQDGSEHWKRVISKFRAAERIRAADQLPLICPRHPQARCTATKAEDLIKVTKDGFCHAACDFVFEICGHVCPSKCHASLHQVCPAPCRRVLECGHGCKGKCGNECGACSELCTVRAFCRSSLSFHSLTSLSAEKT
jgi:hypothetical protein